jgi:pyruvate,water dikinase
LFVGAAAVVAEMGGELSHTMIVSRDLGIPAVVGAVGATTRIKTGDLIAVDGSTGTVRIVERAASDELARSGARRPGPQGQEAVR